MVTITPLRVGQLFQTELVIPLYQRSYVWKEEQLEDFLDALVSHWKDQETDNLFIGPIVLSPEDSMERAYVLVDGQQRVTTFFIVFGVLHEMYERMTGDSQSEGVVSALRQPLLVYDLEQGRYRHRLRNSDADLDSLLRSYMPSSIQLHLDAAYLAKGAHTKGARRRLSSAKRLCHEYLRDQLKNPQQVAQFQNHIRERVEFLPYKSSIEVALRVFESLNGRGIPLRPIDLIKNYLLSKDSPARRDRLAENWNEFMDVFQGYRGPSSLARSIDETDPQRFLRYFLIAKHGRANLLKNRLHLEIGEMEHIGEPEQQNPHEWLLSTTNAAFNYMQLLHASADGVPLPSLRRLHTYFPRQRQHLALLLSALYHGASTESLQDLASFCETVVAASCLLHENSTQNEKRFIAWAAELSGHDCTDSTVVRSFIEARRSQVGRDLGASLHGRLRSMDPDEIEARYLLVLAEESLSGQSVPATNLTLGAVMEEENDAIVEDFFGDAESAYGRLGNLYLRVRGENPPKAAFHVQQTDFFGQSQFLTTRCIGSRLDLPAALSEIAESGRWTEAILLVREQAIISTAAKALGWDSWNSGV